MDRQNDNTGATGRSAIIFLLTRVVSKFRYGSIARIVT